MWILRFQRRRIYPEFLSQESALGEYSRVLMKRKWTVLACVFIVFSVVAIASLKMTPVYEASGSIEINKSDSGLVNFNNSPTFNVDYYDPTELETEVMILQSDLLALQVVKELSLDRRPEFGGKTPAQTSSLDIAPDPLQADAGETSDLLSNFRSNLKVTLSPNTHIVKVSFRSPDKDLTATVVNTLMSTYAENNFKSRFRFDHAGLRLAFQATGGFADESGNVAGKARCATRKSMKFSASTKNKTSPPRSLMN